MTSEQDTAGLLAQLREQTLEWMEEYKIPGVAIGLLVDGKEHTLCLGVTSVENPLPITDDTIFKIGSINKTITATIVMRLVDEGKLDLDVPVCTYLPDLKFADESVTAQATLRHLFNHTGGWVGDIFEDTGAGDDALARIVAKAHEWRQLTPLGTIWSYNNAGFYIAGRIIEVVTGKPYETVVREVLLAPLEMTNSFFFPVEVMTRRFAVGHLAKDEGPVVMPLWAPGRHVNAAGGLASSIRDQLRYARFHLGNGTSPDGQTILSPESMRAMQTPGVPGPHQDKIGISWFIRDVDGTRFLAHSGAICGQTSLLWLAPEQNLACAILNNGDKGNPLMDQVTKWVRKHFLGIVEPEPEPIDLPREQCMAFVGRYVGAADGTTLNLELNDDNFMLHLIPGDLWRSMSMEGPPPLKIAPCSPDRILVVEGDLKGRVAEFLRDENEQIVWLRLGLRLYARQNSTSKQPDDQQAQ
jgi:CubicO group peptidase (beta-lactamase class C family)